MDRRRNLEVIFRIMRYGTRAQALAWLAWNDKNGCYTDADCLSEGMGPLTLEQARELMRESIIDDVSPNGE